MNEQALARLDIILHPYIPKNVNPDNWLHDMGCNILNELDSLGYRLIPELKVLSPGRITDLEKKVPQVGAVGLIAIKALTEAQRDYDQRQIEFPVQEKKEGK